MFDNEVELLPSAKDVEAALLGRLLMPAKDEALLPGILKAKHFYDGRHRVVFESISMLRKQAKPHDLVSVVRHLGDSNRLAAAGGHAFVAALLDEAGTIPSLSHYVEIIVRKARDRAMVRLAENLRRFSLSSPGPETDHRLRALATRIQQVARFDPRADSTGRRTSWTQTALLEEEFPEVKWIVEGLIVDGGVTTLGGKKKIGKSWMALQVAQAVATGTSILDRPTQQGSVIYICLEDGPLRLSKRLKQQGADKDAPVTYLTRFTALDQGGMDELRQLAEKTRPRLIIIDTLAAAKTGRVDENAAGPMADLLNGLHRLSQDLQVGILVVAHHGKHTTGDPGHDIRGSSATPGAADLNVGLYKESGVYLLRAEGRDIGETELRVEFDAAATWAWHLLGDAREMARTEAEEEILRALEELGTADAGKIANHLGKRRPGVQKALKRMREQKRVPFTRDEKDAGKILYGPWKPSK